MTPAPPARGRRIGAWAWLLVALAVTAVAGRLGWWQLDRARAKTALQQEQQARQSLPPLPPSQLARTPAEVPGQLHRSVRVEGHWLAGRTVFLDNRPMAGRAGFHVLTPLQLDDGRAVLVQRGWVARDPADRSRVAAPPPPTGRVQLLARIAATPSRVADFGPEAPGAIRQNLDIDVHACETGLPLLPLLLVQLDDPAAPARDGLLRHWPQPAADVSRHHGYAFQWFALAALAVGLYAWFQLVRPTIARRRRG